MSGPDDEGEFDADDEVDLEDDFDDDFDEGLFDGERDTQWYIRFAAAQLSVQPRWFVSLGEDAFANELPDEMRLLIAVVIAGLRDALLTEDESVRRLYPTAYPDDEIKNAEFAALAHDQLLMARLDSLDVVERTFESETLTATELNAWLQAVNEARLVLGTQLDIGEGDLREYDLEDPDAQQLFAYRILGRILGDLISALHGTLPPPSGAEPPADPEYPE